MSEEDSYRYAPLEPVAESGRLTSRAFNLADLKPIATVALCEVGPTSAENTAPSINLKITQCIRLNDDSLVRLDMDRGVTSARYGAPPGKPISWKVPADDLIAEILTLVRLDDENDTEAHPWEELADAAAKRGIDVDGATLSRLPYQVFLSAEVVNVFVL
jgi:hypothetical protein